MTGNKLLISGQAGVGKTKLTLKLVEEFKEINPDYDIKYIINNGNLDIWDDLKIQLINDKKYLIVIDDANKLKNNLLLINNFIRNKENIKLILTVRNYVKSEIESYLEDYSLIELKEFTREELSNILKSSDFNISEYYIDKIHSISRGNPRIAIMAAIAGLKNELDKINNASQIHEEYFLAVNDSIKSLNDSELLKVAGILSVFKIIDTKNYETIDEIEKYFSINPDKLVSKLKTLYSFEVADEMLGIYKITDQILGEYMFYLIFIKEKKLPFEILLNAYVDKRQFGLSTLLTPIINNYGFDNIKDHIEYDIKQKWEQIKNEDYKAIQYLKDFWHYLTSETLVYLSKRIKTVKQVNLNELEFIINDENYIEHYDDKIIDLIIKFREVPDKFDFALDLLFKYGLSSQLLFSQTLKALKQSFTYGQYSFETKYTIQIKLFNFLYKKTENDEIFFSKTILFIADKYLIDSYDFSRSYGDAFHIIPKAIQLSNEHCEFRKRLWNFIFSSYGAAELKDAVLDFFLKHHYSHYFEVNEIITFDNKLIIPFFESNFSNTNFKESMVVNQFSNRFKRFIPEQFEDFETKFLSKEFKTWLLLNDREGDSKQVLLDTFKNYKASDYLEFLNEIEIIEKYQPNCFNGFSTISASISTIFEDLAKRKFNLFIEIIENAAQRKISNKIRMEGAFKSINYTDENLSVLRKVIIEKEANHIYLLNLILNVPINSITKSDYDLSIDFINKEVVKHIAFIEELFTRVSHLNMNLELELTKIFKILLFKTQQEGYIYVHHDFFKYAHKYFPSSFENNIEIIKKIYLNLDGKERHFDYGLDVLKLILEYDSTFITDLLFSNFNNKKRISKRDISDNDFSKLWDMDNYEIIFKQIIAYFNSRPIIFRYTPCEVSNLFKGNNYKEITFLKNLLDKTTDGRLMKRIYNIVVTKYNKMKLNFLEIILSKNSDLEFFKELDFYVQSILYNGNEIPRIHYRIEVYKETMAFIIGLNKLEYLEHINLLEKAITNSKVSIENAKKREFIDKWGL